MKLDPFRVLLMIFLILATSVILSYACNPRSEFESFVHSNQPLATRLSDKTLISLHKTSSLVELKEIFDQINRIRPVGTAEHARVKQFIIKFLTTLNIKVELDHFESKTPFGNFNFTNIIGTVDPTRDQNLVLACHYESKLMNNFYGSTDSALPCALILKIVESLAESIKSQENMKLGLQVIFFDGEEAFDQWTRQDSLYGSRHLAAKWHSELDKNGRTKLSKINLMVLLDLLGASSPTIPNYGLENVQAYQALVHLESRFRNLGLLRSNTKSAPTYFGHTAYGLVQDDHIPFMEQGVQVLHLIPSPFPSVWHTPNDNAGIIDWDTSLDLLNILEAFVRTYMHLLV